MIKRSSEIDSFILDTIRDYDDEVIKRTIDEYGISRQAVNKHIKKLIQQKFIGAEGATKGRKYFLLPKEEHKFYYDEIRNLKEDIVYRDQILLYIKDFPDETRKSCNYCFTEICNNAIEHSEGSKIQGYVKIYENLIKMAVIDNGVGIFNKIQRECNLDDPLYAIFDLAKGKLTTEPETHTGEGVFFVSKICNCFHISSYNLGFIHTSFSEDYLLEQDNDYIGTGVIMEIFPNALNKIGDVFKKFSSDSDKGFSKTIIPISLAQYGADNLISRSQARRIIERFDRFKSIILDFKDVEMIGQSFTDEIFRVFHNKNPKIKLDYINANTDVENMIQHVLSEL